MNWRNRCVCSREILPPSFSTRPHPRPRRHHTTLRVRGSATGTRRASFPTRSTSKLASVSRATFRGVRRPHVWRSQVTRKTILVRRKRKSLATRSTSRTPLKRYPPRQRRRRRTLSANSESKSPRRTLSPWSSTSWTSASVARDGITSPQFSHGRNSLRAPRCALVSPHRVSLR